LSPDEEVGTILEYEDRRRTQEREDASAAQPRQWRGFAGHQLAPLALIVGLLWVLAFLLYPAVSASPSTLAQSTLYWVVVTTTPMLTVLAAVGGYLTVKRFLYLRHLVPITAGSPIELR